MKKYKADIVVISAGTAGLPAAVTAAEGGASVIILEKTGRTGGGANRGNMLFAVESKMQKALPGYMTKEEAFNIHMEWTHWRVDPKLVSAFINHSGNTIDWLQDEGVEFQEIRTSGFPVGSGVVIGFFAGFSSDEYAADDSDSGNLASCTINIKGLPPGPKMVGQAAAMAQVLTRRAKGLGIKFFMKTTAKKILKKGKVVTGVLAEDATGAEIQINAKAVIVATGGIAGNKAWMKENLGLEEGKNYFAMQKIGLTGDGIRMAWEAGAAHTPVMPGATHNMLLPVGANQAFSAFMRPENLMVNLVGERFSNDDMIHSYGGVAIHGTIASVIIQQPGKVAFLIFDGNLKKYYEEKAKKATKMPQMPQMPTVFQHDDLDDNIREARAKGYKTVFMADSLEDLCLQTGIDYEGLKRTLDEYNGMCAAGKDEFFYKSPEYLKPIKGPRFYAAKVVTGDYGTAGGIKTNYKMEVLTPDFRVIPGLYAAGNDANNLYDHSYTILAGNYIGFAVNSGRMAAESALEYIKTLAK
jgi:fumarate reductase flavoprotein subunit